MLPQATRADLLAFRAQIEPARTENRLDAAQTRELGRLPELAAVLERIGGLFPDLPHPPAP